mmetsp:Transcript_26145/g.69791  ORF Transcript_26145/g.69791 Transcript_26145/m.69791 type:complete len:311 (-) Transcript_26145:358-1290(-)
MRLTIGRLKRRGPPHPVDVGRHLRAAPSCIPPQSAPFLHAGVAFLRWCSWRRTSIRSIWSVVQNTSLVRRPSCLVASTVAFHVTSAFSRAWASAAFHAELAASATRRLSSPALAGGATSTSLVGTSAPCESAATTSAGSRGRFARIESRLLCDGGLRSPGVGAARPALQSSAAASSWPHWSHDEAVALRGGGAGSGRRARGAPRERLVKRSSGRGVGAVRWWTVPSAVRRPRRPTSTATVPHTAERAPLDLAPASAPPSETGAGSMMCTIVGLATGSTAASSSSTPSQKRAAPPISSSAWRWGSSACRRS